MTFRKIRILQIILATAIGAGCLAVSEKASLTNPGSLITEASAIVGRPLTPMSYAGVARRTTARAVYAAPVMQHHTFTRHRSMRLRFMQRHVLRWSTSTGKLRLCADKRNGVGRCASLET